MTTAGLMLAHQVAGKAVRDATFLSAWPSSALPTMVIAAAAAAVLAVPVYAALLAAIGPRIVVPSGFLLSAVGHVLEWRLVGTSPWGAAVVYIHIASFCALLLSGFWSLISELFDPRLAKARYGEIAASGTLGGLAGGLVTARLAAAWPADSPLLFLALLHVACAAAVLWLGRWPAVQRAQPSADESWSGLFRFDALRHAPQLRTLALLIVTSTSGAAIVDFLLKAEAARPDHFASRPALLGFFAVFYTGVQILTFVVQAAAGLAVKQVGLGRTIGMLPLGLAATGGVALLFPTFNVLTIVRATEAVLRGSVFRSGYELLFVPMDPVEKRRTKTFLDVTCDRAGDAIGALVVWLLLLTDASFQKAELVATVVALSLAGMWLARRIDTLYLDVVERHLVKQGGLTPVVVGSETGWSILELPTPVATPPVGAPRPPVVVGRLDDTRLRVLAELRSGDRALVEAALGALVRPDAMLTSQVIQLLAWDDVALAARRVLERAAATHSGMLVDALLDPDTDFAIRRRIPHVLGSLASDRALDGLVRGLEDARFEVRYRCGRAIDRMLSSGSGATVAADRILAAVDRELSVSPAVWRGYQLIDRLDSDESAGGPARQAERNLEHVITLLSAVLPREPLQVAFRGMQSSEPGLRALAVEYLDGVLPPDIRSKLWALMETRPEHPVDRASLERTLERLRQSTEIRLPAVGPATASSAGAPGQSGPPRTATDPSDPR